MTTPATEELGMFLVPTTFRNAFDLKIFGATLEECLRIMGWQKKVPEQQDGYTLFREQVSGDELKIIGIFIPASSSCQKVRIDLVRFIRTVTTFLPLYFFQALEEAPGNLLRTLFEAYISKEVIFFPPSQPDQPPAPILIADGCVPWSEPE